MKIEVELNYSGEETIDDAIIAAAGVALAAHLYRDASYEGYPKLADSLRAEAIAAVRRDLEPIIREALTVPFPKTNNYGEPTGQTATLRELIVGEARLWLEKKDGTYDRQKPRFQTFIAEEVDKAIKRELTEAMNEAKAEVMAAVKERGAEVIAETIQKLAGVR